MHCNKEKDYRKKKKKAEEKIKKRPRLKAEIMS